MMSHVVRDGWVIVVSVVICVVVIVLASISAAQSASRCIAIGAVVSSVAAPNPNGSNAQIAFPGQCSVTQHDERGAIVEIPARYRDALKATLQAQAWVSSVFVWPLDDKSLNVYWSAAYVYPAGEPLRSVQRLCDDALQGGEQR